MNQKTERLKKAIEYFASDKHFNIPQEKWQKQMGAYLELLDDPDCQEYLDSFFPTPQEDCELIDMSEEGNIKAKRLIKACESMAKKHNITFQKAMNIYNGKEKL